jgi:hypothetical protein
MLQTTLFGVVCGLIAALLLYTPGPGRRLRHRIAYTATRKVWESGQAVVGMRVVAGSQDGLGTSWSTGAALASPGRVDFTRYVGGVSLFKRPLPPMRILGVDGPPRRLPARSMLRLDPDAQVTTLRTPTATLEFAVMPPIPADAVLARLAW